MISIILSGLIAPNIAQFLRTLVLCSPLLLLASLFFLAKFIHLLYLRDSLSGLRNLAVLKSLQNWRKQAL